MRDDKDRVLLHQLVQRSLQSSVLVSCRQWQWCQTGKVCAEQPDTSAGACLHDCLTVCIQRTRGLHLQRLRSAVSCKCQSSQKQLQQQSCSHLVKQENLRLAHERSGYGYSLHSTWVTLIAARLRRVMQCRQQLHCSTGAASAVQLQASRQLTCRWPSESCTPLSPHSCTAAGTQPSCWCRPHSPHADTCA